MPAPPDECLRATDLQEAKGMFAEFAALDLSEEPSSSTEADKKRDIS
jgi:hypothetical protein